MNKEVSGQTGSLTAPVLLSTTSVKDVPLILNSKSHAELSTSTCFDVKWLEKLQLLYWLLRIFSFKDYGHPGWLD